MNENRDARSAIGSNNWAVAGSRTAHGGAIVANDMHLSCACPISGIAPSSSSPTGTVNSAASLA